MTISMRLILTTSILTLLAQPLLAYRAYKRNETKEKSPAHI